MKNMVGAQVIIFSLLVLTAGCTSSHDGAPAADAGASEDSAASSDSNTPLDVYDAADGSELADAGAEDVSQDSGPMPVLVPASGFIVSHPLAPGGQSRGFTAEIEEDSIDGEDSVVLSAPEGAMGSDWGATTSILPIEETDWNQRFRMRAMVRTEDAGLAFAWLRIDQDAGGYVLDNMLRPVSRGISGTTEWTEVQLVLDVPENAVRFALGSGLFGSGRIWMGPVTLERVGDDVPVTPSIRMWE